MAFTLLLILSLLFGPAKTPIPLKSLPALVHQTQRSIVRITRPVVDDEGKPSTYYCAAFVVSASKGWAVTARHCVRPNKPLFADGHVSEILKTDDWLALVTVTPMERPPLSIADDPPELGEEAISLGYGLGREMVIIRHVSSLDERNVEELMGDDRQSGMFILDGGLVPGMSGGPTVNVYGEVIGVNQATATMEPLSILSGVAQLKHFLKSSK